MGRKKLNFDCKYCGQSTEVMDKPIYVDSYKARFCDMECYNFQKEEDAKNEVGNKSGTT